MTSADPTPDAVGPSERSTAARVLVACGALYGLSYMIANDVVAASRFHGYNRIDQAVSELSAKGAASRPFLVAMLPIWTALMIAFGIGITMSANRKRVLRITGGVLIAHGVVAITWLWFPMTSRQDLVRAGTSSNDTGHLVLTTLTIVFILAELVFVALAFGTWFRVYSAVTAATALVFGALVGPLAAGIPDGKPTPWMGLYERISIGGWLLWMTVLTVTLLRTPGSTPKTARSVSEKSTTAATSTSRSSAASGPTAPKTRAASTGGTTTTNSPVTSAVAR